MLVLTRKENERLQIGDDIVITIVRIAGGAVRIGVEAPAHYSIVRQELADRLAAEKRQSAAEHEASHNPAASNELPHSPPRE